MNPGLSRPERRLTPPVAFGTLSPRLWASAEGNRNPTPEYADLKVAIDIQSTVSRAAGVGRYTRNLVRQLGAQAGTDRLVLFYFDFKRAGDPFPVSGAAFRAERRIPGRLVQAAWKIVSWPPFDRLAGEADVYHFPNFIRPPLRRGRSVVTIHDLSFLRFPETAEKRNLAYLKKRISGTVRAADAIVTGSEFSAGEIEELLGVPRSKIHPIHDGLAEHIRPPGAGEVAELRSRLDLDRPYLLHVGTLEPRKNIPFLVEIFERLRNFDGCLVLAGMKGWSFEPILRRIESSRLARRIRRLDYVADGDLPALYAGAELFVFPSLYEGFGFPPLEALAVGTPVLASRRGSLPEVLGEAAELIGDFDAALWAERIENLISDPAARERARTAGRDRALGFSWRETARRTWDLYRHLGGERA